MCVYVCVDAQKSPEILYQYQGQVECQPVLQLECSWAKIIRGGLDWIPGKSFFTLRVVGQWNKLPGKWSSGLTRVQEGFGQCSQTHAVIPGIAPFEISTFCDFVKFPFLHRSPHHGDRLCLSLLLKNHIDDSPDFPKIFVLDWWQCLKKHII